MTLLQMLLGLTYLGSTTAFNAALSMSIPGMYASYFSPIVCMFIYGRRSSAPVIRGLNFGMFNLCPRLGPVVNVIAMMWLVLAIAFSTFPTVEPVTPYNMNYSVVVTMGWIVIGGTYYYVFGGKKQFTGPSVELAGVV